MKIQAPTGTILDSQVDPDQVWSEGKKPGSGPTAYRFTDLRADFTTVIIITGTDHVGLMSDDPLVTRTVEDNPGTLVIIRSQTGEKSPDDAGADDAGWRVVPRGPAVPFEDLKAQGITLY